jgi:hypothetical protein
MLNAYTWRWSHPQGSYNLILMGLALSFFGVIFVSIPRYYLELQWFWARIAQQPDERYEDLRSWNLPFIGPWDRKPTLVAHVLDTLLIGGFIASFWF